MLLEAHCCKICCISVQNKHGTSKSSKLLNAELYFWTLTNCVMKEGLPWLVRFYEAEHIHDRDSFRPCITMLPTVPMGNEDSASLETPHSSFQQHTQERMIRYYFCINNLLVEKYLVVSMQQTFSSFGQPSQTEVLACHLCCCSSWHPNLSSFIFWIQLKHVRMDLWTCHCWKCK